MFTSPAQLLPTLLLLLLLLPALIHALTLPAPEPTTTPSLNPRADPTIAWITVDSTGLASTITPVVTISDGVPTTLSAIPPDLTATVLTRTEYGEVVTSTGTAPALPTAQNAEGKGYFLACSNVDGEAAPFCEPSKAGGDLYVGTTYYGE